MATKRAAASGVDAENSRLESASLLQQSQSSSKGDGKNASLSKIECMAVKSESKPWSMLQIGVLLGLVCQNTAVVLLMRYVRLPRAEAPIFIKSTIVLVTEVCKFYLSLALMYWFDHERSMGAMIAKIHSELSENYVNFFKMCIPSLIYVVQNNLLYVAISNLDPGTFQVTYQTKVLTAAMMVVCVFRRSLGSNKWRAIGLLFTGICLVQYNPESKSNAAQSVGFNRFKGVAAAVAASFCSAAAGVYIEMVMKRGSSTSSESSSQNPVRTQSLWLKNCQLAFFSVFFASFACFAQDIDAIRRDGFFYGYDAAVLGVVALQAGGGLLIGAVLKYTDNILKAFATSVSTVLATVFSIYFFGEVPTMYFILGASFVLCSVYMYSKA